MNNLGVEPYYFFSIFLDLILVYKSGLWNGNLGITQGF